MEDERDVCEWNPMEECGARSLLREAEAQLSAWRKWAGRFAGAPVPDETLRANADARFEELSEAEARAEQAEADHRDGETKAETIARKAGFDGPEHGDGWQDEADTLGGTVGRDE